METRFEEIKREILKRAKEAQACCREYGRAYNADSMQELCHVIKDNFDWCCYKKVLTVELIEAYREDFSVNSIFTNVNVNTGFLLCDNATVKASGNATVEASGNATVKAWGNATVEAWGNAYCSSYEEIKCTLSGNAIYRIRKTNRIRYSSDSISFERV